MIVFLDPVLLVLDDWLPVDLLCPGLELDVAEPRLILEKVEILRRVCLRGLGVLLSKSDYQTCHMSVELKCIFRNCSNLKNRLLLMENPKPGARLYKILHTWFWPKNGLKTLKNSPKERVWQLVMFLNLHFHSTDMCCLGLCGEITVDSIIKITLTRLSEGKIVSK